MDWRVKGKHVGWLAAAAFFAVSGYGDLLELNRHAWPWIKPLVLFVGAMVGADFCWKRASR